jgi:hypothetical protein
MCVGVLLVDLALERKKLRSPGLKSDVVVALADQFLAGALEAVLANLDFRCVRSTLFPRGVGIRRAGSCS